jgi:hypothetical protein
MMKKSFVGRQVFLFIILTFVLFMFGCAMSPPKPDELVAPQARLDNGGEFLCPYTQDGVLAEWVDQAINAKAASAAGGLAGAYAGQQLLENIPFVGGIIGQTVGEEAGRRIAIQYAGGMENIKNTSDVSFDTVDDLAVYLYVVYSANEHYQDALSATMEIYPDLKKQYSSTLMNASKKE